MTYAHTQKKELPLPALLLMKFLHKVGRLVVTKNKAWADF